MPLKLVTATSCKVSDQADRASAVQDLEGARRQDDPHITRAPNQTPSISSATRRMKAWTSLFRWGFPKWILFHLVDSWHSSVQETTSSIRNLKRCVQVHFDQALSLEGVSQMDSIPPGTLLTLVRPGNDLVLRRIRNLKRCVQACGCNITTPRYAPQFGSRLHFKRGQPLPMETPFPFFSGPLFWGPLSFLFLVFS